MNTSLPFLKHEYYSLYVYIYIYTFLRINTIFVILNNVHWIKGFTRKIGITNSLIAKLWRLRDELLICSICNFDCVENELDAKAIIDVLANPNYVNNIVSYLEWLQVTDLESSLGPV